MATIQIQSVGKVNAKPAAEFSVGEKMLWNFGYSSEILEIVKETPTQIVFKINSISPTGKVEDFTGERRLKKTRLVAIA